MQEVRGGLQRREVVARPRAGLEAGRGPAVDDQPSVAGRDGEREADRSGHLLVEPHGAAGLDERQPGELALVATGGQHEVTGPDAGALTTRDRIEQAVRDEQVQYVRRRQGSVRGHGSEGRRLGSHHGCQRR